MNKESQDALQLTQRLLRYGLQMRVTSLLRCSTSAIQAARRPMTMFDPCRAQVESRPGTKTDQLKQVCRRVTQLMADLPSTDAA